MRTWRVFAEPVTNSIILNVLFIACLSVIIVCLFAGLLGMMPPGAMLPSQVQPGIMIAVPPKPEDTIAVCIAVLLLCCTNCNSTEQCGCF